MVDHIFCAICSHEFANLEEATRLSPERPACPNCGSLVRKGTILESISLRVHVEAHGKGKPAAGGKRFIEFVQNKLELNRDTGRWRLIDRTIDRRHDTYDEEIKDRATGETVHETHEPLSEHRNHGSARRSPPG